VARILPSPLRGPGLPVKQMLELQRIEGRLEDSVWKIVEELRKYQRMVSCEVLRSTPPAGGGNSGAVGHGLAESEGFLTIVSTCLKGLSRFVQLAAARLRTNRANSFSQVKRMLGVRASRDE